MIHIDFTNDIIYVEGDDRLDLATFELWGRAEDISVQQEGEAHPLRWQTRATGGSGVYVTLYGIRRPGRYHIRSGARGQGGIRDLYLDIQDHGEGVCSLTVGAESTRTTWVVGSEILRPHDILPWTAALTLMPPDPVAPPQTAWDRILGDDDLGVE